MKKLWFISLVALGFLQSQAFAQSYNHAPPALGSTAKVQRDDMVLEYNGIEADKVDFVDIDTCAEIAAIVAGETGTCGSLVLSSSPTLVTPNLGTPSALTLTNATGLGDSGLSAGAVDGGSGGEIEDGTIDGEDLNSNVAGAALVETAGSPDTIDINLNATGPGLAIGSDSLSLLRSCSDGQILKWTAGTTSWGCAADAGAGGGISNVSEDTSPTLGGDLEGAGFDIGTVGSQIDDVFLAEASCLNWDNGDLTLCQSGNVATISGGLLSGASVEAATTSVAGVAEFADNSETITGTSTTQSTTPAGVAAAIAAAVPASAYPPGTLYGCVISNAADTNNDITIQPCKTRDETDTGNMVLGSAITKQMDAGWAVGTNAGCLNTGSEAANTWYEVIEIKRVDTGVVDVMCSTTANRATLPANYTLSRRIGWIRNDSGSALLQFTQTGDYFTLTTDVADVSTNITTTAASVTLTAPPNSIARFRATIAWTTSIDANLVIAFYELSQGTVTPSTSTGVGSLGAGDSAAGEDAGHFELRVNSSSQIAHDSSANPGSANAFKISTYGWIDNRVRLGP